MMYVITNEVCGPSFISWKIEHKDIAFSVLKSRAAKGLEPVLRLVASDNSILQTHYIHPELGLITEDETACEIHAKFALDL